MIDISNKTIRELYFEGYTRAAYWKACPYSNTNPHKRLSGSPNIINGTLIKLNPKLLWPY